MAKLYFRYASMSAGKSSNLLQTAHNYKEHGKEVIIFTPSIDNRYGSGKVTSRIGLEADAIIIHPNDYSVLNDLLERLSTSTENFGAVFVDECQFLDPKAIDILSDIVDTYDIPVFCYGLRTDFSTEMFNGSKRLFEIADSIEELKNVCSCGKKAIFNARLTESTEKIVIGGNDMYQSMCRNCYKKFKGSL